MMKPDDNLLRQPCRRDVLRLGSAACVGAIAGSAFGAPRKPYWPQGSSWETRAPKDAGMDPAGVDEAVQYAADHNSTGLVILRGGRIVAENYWKDWTAETSQPIYSSSKSITATLVGMAIEEGIVRRVDQTASDFVPAWKSSPKSEITIRHMMTMTSGIKNTPGTNVRADVDAFEETAALPLEHRPGEVWAYNTPIYRMLLRILETASGGSIDRYTERKLSGPLGMRYSRWDCGPAPNNKTNCSWYRSCLRDMSRFGLMILRNGQWDGKQLVSARYIREMTATSQKLNEAYGYLWWLNGKDSYRLPGGAGGVNQGMLWPDCPADAFGALGAQDKKIYIVPSLDLVVSRHGGPAGIARGPGAEGGGRNSFDNELLGRICRAVRK